MRDPDPDTMLAAQRGDITAFESIVRLYQPEVWRLAVQIVRDERLAEDVVQETFVRVYRFLPRFKGDAKFNTWLYSITRNCALDSLKSAERQTKVRERLSGTRPGNQGDVGLRFEIKQAIALLPLELREPLVMVDMFEMTYAEVAKIVGVPVGTVKSRVFRARSNLIEALGPGTQGMGIGRED